jgi:hypothetical protein
VRNTKLWNLFESIEETPRSAEQAYVARIRLRRMLVGCAEQVAVKLGLPAAVELGNWPEDRGGEQTVASIYRAVYQRTMRICQPSEPFDERWTEQWAALRADVRSLLEGLDAS